MQELAIPPPQIHHLTLGPILYKNEDEDKPTPCWFRSYTQQGSPALLFVNRESHAIASKHYSLAFAYKDAQYPDRGFAETWFDFVYTPL